MRTRAPQGGKCLDLEWKRARTRKANAARRTNQAKLREQRAVKYETKGAAYTAGYRLGYTAAMHWWQRKVERDLQHNNRRAS